MTDRKVRRGEIYYADLPETESGSVQAGRRPVLITQCDRLNRTSTTVLVAIAVSYTHLDVYKRQVSRV